ncbi:hypothetical protein [Halorussus salinus]|uniref:hypothetical protein n=1 Tax=Halorussus salinus TaxID=1364935 RepID=UPI00138F4AD2|nr:hypothetical protein [Halorussus salinus]
MWATSSGQLFILVAFSNDTFSNDTFSNDTFSNDTFSNDTFSNKTLDDSLPGPSHRNRSRTTEPSAPLLDRCVVSPRASLLEGAAFNETPRWDRA